MADRVSPSPSLVIAIHHRFFPLGSRFSSRCKGLRQLLQRWRRTASWSPSIPITYGQAQTRGHPRSLKIRQRKDTRQVYRREGRSDYSLLRGPEPLIPISAVHGILKGYDQLLNLVLDEVEEEILGKPCFQLAPAVSLLNLSINRTRATQPLTRSSRPTRSYNNAREPCRRIRGDCQSLQHAGGMKAILGLTYALKFCNYIQCNLSFYSI